MIAKTLKMTRLYSELEEARKIFSEILNDKNLKIPEEIKSQAQRVQFFSTLEKMAIPCPLKECETAAALKGVEALMALAIAKLRLNIMDSVKIDLHHALLFMFLTYLISIDGLTKLDPEVKSKLKATDLNNAQAILYRRMSANLYKTKDAKFYHIHGSLEASKTLDMIGLPPYAPKVVKYEDVIEVIQTAVQKFTADELEVLNEERKQAGVEALTQEEFLRTEHGRVISKEPLWKIERLESDTPPAKFSPLVCEPKPQILKGIKVLELCRVIAGPTIGKILAEYGATVLKVTSSNLPDVPFFQADCNIGKHTTDLNLKKNADREIFERLLEDCDIVIDGFRENAISKLGYGPHALAKVAKNRGKGIIYASENCFGFTGEWSHRPGWQQIADCASGVAWIQGKSLGLNEPMVPPFPMSDYGTGCVVTISILLAVYKRALFGGSYWCKSSLIQYDLFLLKQGTIPEEVWKNILNAQDPDIFKLRYYDSVDKISSTALKSMKQAGALGNRLDDFFDVNYSPGFKGNVKYLKPVPQFDSLDVGYGTPTRPNGYDLPQWW